MEAEGEAQPARKVVVRTSPARSIVFKAQRSLGRCCLPPEGALLEYAEYTLHGSERYVRVEVTDAEGRKAWTNPFFLD